MNPAARPIAAALVTLATALVSTTLKADGSDASAAGLVKRGEFLAIAANCASCHTKPRGGQLAGGVSFHTPFGTVYSTNITPDIPTGIGGWTLEQFQRAMREGTRPNGEHLYPVFPYTAFTKLSDADIRALFAYLQTVPAVRQPAPANDLSFPFNRRGLIAVWKFLFFDNERFTPSAEESAESNRGAYLVEALGHCGACHTPRNAFGAERATLALSGGTYLDRVSTGAVRSWSAVNLTPASDGLGAWTVDDIVEYLKTGMNAYATSFGPMNDVIANSTRHMSDSDLRAVATYLKALPARTQSPGLRPSAAALREGEALYSIHCATCHLPSGQGAIETGPSLIGNPVVLAADPASLINVILFGPELPQFPLVQRTRMEPYAGKLSDDEMAALASFVRNAWSNRATSVSAKQIAAQR
jgi:mono/diheme cytochrome c family protein